MIQVKGGKMRQFLSVLIALVAILPVAAMGHPGGMSPKDGCHRDKKAGERHWHAQGAERGGPCIDGKQVEDPKPEPTRAELKRALTDLEHRLRRAEDGRERDRVSHRIAMQKASSAVQAAESRAKRLVAAANRREAMMERKLKAVVNGTAVCRLERSALEEKAAQFWGGGWRDPAKALLACLRAGE